MKRLITIEPREILGVGPDATPAEVESAFRAAAQRHHPDHGGDALMFRLITKAHDLLKAGSTSTAVAEEASRRRPGAVDPHVEAWRIVDVEVLNVHYDLVGVDRSDPESQNLSGCLIVGWPSEGMDPGAGKPVGEVLDALRNVFELMPISTRVVSTRTSVTERTFQGWISYANGKRAAAAFLELRAKIRRAGLGVREWTRELIVPLD